MKQFIIFLIIIISIISCDSDSGNNNSVSLTYEINFDEDLEGNNFVSGDEIYDQYSQWHVTFALPAVSPRIIANLDDPFDVVPVSEPFLLGGNPDTGIGSSTPLTISFSENVSSVSFWVIDNESDGGTVLFYDGQDVIIETLSIQNLSTGVAQKISSSVKSIRKVIVTSGSASDGLFIDDLNYTIH